MTLAINQMDDDRQQDQRQAEQQQWIQKHVLAPNLRINSDQARNERALDRIPRLARRDDSQLLLP